MRIAIAQMPMQATCAGNTDGVMEHLGEAAALGAEVVVFPECATTGYHRDVPAQVSRGFIHDALARVREACAKLRLAAVVGTPYYPAADDGVVWNAAVVVGPGGDVLAVCPKVGLTKGEHRFFTPGADRPRFRLASFSCGLMLCREVRDARQRLTDGSDRITFWPGVISWEPDGGDPEDDVTPEIAVAGARTLGSYVVQCNWSNSVNRPRLRGMGGSLVLAPTGELLYESPRDTAGLFTMDLDPAGVAAA